MISPMIVDGNPYFYLNEKGHSLVCARDFVPMSDTGTCKGYQSMDPRTVDAPRAIRTTYDRPPLYSKNTQPIENLYTDRGARTGFYKDYRDIKTGNIFYYTDADQADPYGIDPYTLTSFTQPQIDVDPMGAYLPVYQKIPVFQNNRNSFEYTFDQDQAQFREDIMALQSRQINRSDFQFYHLFQNPKQYFPSTRLARNETSY